MAIHTLTSLTRDALRARELDRHTKRTKIVATLGPASRSPEMLRALVLAGVDVFRLNFSHGTHEEHRATAAAVRDVAKSLGRAVGLLQDLQGPKIRVGRFAGGAIELHAGEPFTLKCGADAELGSKEWVSVSLSHLYSDVQPGQMLLLNDGNIRLVVEDIRERSIHTRVVVGGALSDRKGVNVPESALSIPALTDKDIADLRFGSTLDIDWVALSFVQRPEDLVQARSLLTETGSTARLMAKIEKPQAVLRFDEVLRECDGVMVARGDLGVEMPPEVVPMVQKRIIMETLRVGKPVITATQMLESMIAAPTPTRAEASDVANAIFDGTDAVMLSAETATGQYPLEAVAIMRRVALNVEDSPQFARHLETLRPEPTKSTADAIAVAVLNVSQTVEARAIVVFTMSGSSAWRIARHRPPMPVIALTPDERVRNQLALVCGVIPHLSRSAKDTDDMMAIARQHVLESGIAGEGQKYVIVAGVPFGVPGTTNTLRVEKL